MYGLDFMTLVTPKGFKPPPKFPRGELLCVNSDGERVRSYSASRVLKWLAWAESMEATPCPAPAVGADFDPRDFTDSEIIKNGMDPAKFREAMMGNFPAFPPKDTDDEETP